MEGSAETCIINDLLALMEMNGGDESSPGVEIKEEMVVEVMQELWKEINSSYTEQYNFSPPPAIFSAPAPVLAVGGDNERCGPVLSAAASTVMAGVGRTNVFSGEEAAVVEGRDLGCSCGSMKESGGKMDGCDDGEVDDEWLTRVLSMDPQEFEELGVGP